MAQDSDYPDANLSIYEELRGVTLGILIAPNAWGNLVQ